MPPRRRRAASSSSSSSSTSSSSSCSSSSSSAASRGRSNRKLTLRQRVARANAADSVDGMVVWGIAGKKMHCALCDSNVGANSNSSYQHRKNPRHRGLVQAARNAANAPQAPTVAAAPHPPPNVAAPHAPPVAAPQAPPVAVPQARPVAVPQAPPVAVPQAPSDAPQSPARRSRSADSDAQLVAVVRDVAVEIRELRLAVVAQWTAAQTNALRPSTTPPVMAGLQAGPRPTAATVTAQWTAAQAHAVPPATQPILSALTTPLAQALAPATATPRAAASLPMPPSPTPTVATVVGAQPHTPPPYKPRRTVFAPAGVPTPLFEPLSPDARAELPQPTALSPEAARPPPPAAPLFEALSREALAEMARRPPMSLIDDE